MQTEVSTDHRVRVGREKREKMRKRLLQAVMACYAAREDHTTPGIDDVIREADVSRATFYLHFVSMEVAFHALRAELDNDLHVVAIEHLLLMARDAKLVHFNEVAAARDLLLGSMSEAMRTLSNASGRSRVYVEELTVMMLCGLRADHARSKEVVHDRAIYIRGYAPDCLPWWKDPWAGSSAV